MQKNNLKRLVDNAQKLLLKEQLVPVNLEDLNLQIQDDPYLEELLTTDATRLPERYQYLIDEEFAQASLGGLTLYKLIKLSQWKTKNSFFLKLKIKSQVS